MARAVDRETNEATKECARELHAVLGNHIGFNPPARVGVHIFRLTGPGQTDAVDNQRRVPVLKLAEAENGDTFWVGVSLTFRSDRATSRLEHAVAAFFRGLPSDAVKSCLFRADWHQWAGGDRAAQPHWHVFHQQATTARAEPVEAMAAAPAEFGLEGAEEDMAAIAPDKPSLEGFHFAMCSTWVSEPARRNGHRHDLAPESLKHWLRLCIEYAQEQLLSLR